MNDEIHKVIAPDVVAIQRVIEGEGRPEHSSWRPEPIGERSPELNIGVEADADQIIKNKWHAERIPVRHNTESQQYESRSNRPTLFIGLALLHRPAMSNSRSMAIACGLPGAASSTVMR